MRNKKSLISTMLCLLSLLAFQVGCIEPTESRSTWSTGGEISKPLPEPRLPALPIESVRSEFEQELKNLHPFLTYYSGEFRFTRNQPIVESDFVTGRHLGVEFEGPSGVTIDLIRPRLRFSARQGGREEIGTKSGHFVDLNKKSKNKWQIVIPKSTYDEAMKVASEGQYGPREIGLVLTYRVKSTDVGLTMPPFLGLPAFTEESEMTTLGTVSIPLLGPTSAPWTGDIHRPFIDLSEYSRKASSVLAEKTQNYPWVLRGTGRLGTEWYSPDVKVRLEISNPLKCKLELDGKSEDVKCDVMDEYLVLENRGRLLLSSSPFNHSKFGDFDLKIDSEFVTVHMWQEKQRPPETK